MFTVKKNCENGFFHCDSDRCIPLHSVCDGVADCYDKTDETNFDNCTQIKCPEDHFKCAKSVRCIPNKWVCDQNHDCGKNDLSDELNCPPVECKIGTEFRCTSGQCVSLMALCNGVSDCHDMSDEIGCVNIYDNFIPPWKNGNCSEHMFQCSDGKCIELKNRCNGVADCDDGSDEDKTDCSEGKFFFVINQQK